MSACKTVLYTVYCLIRTYLVESNCVLNVVIFNAQKHFQLLIFNCITVKVCILNANSGRLYTGVYPKCI